MEEVHREALEYYNNSSYEVKAVAVKLFNRMDADGDSSINVAELASFIKGFKILSRRVTPEELIIGIDRNGNGSLDFNEFITFFWLIFSLCVCDGCGAKLMGQRHLTCLSCFTSGADDTFDLCSKCFSSENFAHPHTCFVNFEALLLAMASESQTKTKNEMSKKQRLISKLTTPEALEKLEIINRAAKTSLEVVQQVTSSGGCNIM